MSPWAVDFVEPAMAELLALPADMQAKVLRIVELLQVGGPAEVGMPLVRPLGNKLYEMRASGRDGIARAVYFAASGRRLIVLRVFVKKTTATPSREIEIALRRMKEL